MAHKHSGWTGEGAGEGAGSRWGARRSEVVAAAAACPDGSSADRVAVGSRAARRRASETSEAERTIEKSTEAAESGT